MTALLLLKRFWPVLAGIALVIGLIVWHNGQVSAAFRKGASEQATADRKAYAAAETLAIEKQAKVVAAVKAKFAAINKDTTDALRSDTDDIARRYDALRLRWEAYRADQGRAGQGGATAVPDAAGSFDLASCAAQGWVSFDVAATAAQAADTAIAKDDAWIKWAAEQEAEWPD
jgi:hypothetical protein